jgi:soluble lytic murein transglycosylase-like protein
MGSGENSYIDRAPSDIAKIESVPDPPPPSAEPVSISPQSEAQLSPVDLHEMLVRAGQQHNLDADLLASVVKAESNGNARAVSRAGARGLMQLMPGTAAEEGVDDSFRPDQNVRGGSAYLNELLVRYHDNIALALAAYNAGPAAVAKYHGIPPYHETRAYVARVIHEFNRRVLAREAEARQSSPSPIHPVPNR